MKLFELAQRFIGEIREIPGEAHHPFIQWAHMLCNLGESQPDEVPWCSSFINACCWLLRLPRSKSAAARSWLSIGQAIELHNAMIGDVVILKRGSGDGAQGPEVLNAPGHVGLFAGADIIRGTVNVLGGNQSDGVTVASFKSANVIGVRRLA